MNVLSPNSSRCGRADFCPGAAVNTERGVRLFSWSQKGRHQGGPRVFGDRRSALHVVLHRCFSGVSSGRSSPERSPAVWGALRRSTPRQAWFIRHSSIVELQPGHVGFCEVTGLHRTPLAGNTAFIKLVKRLSGRVRRWHFQPRSVRPGCRAYPLWVVGGQYQIKMEGGR
jgi:hypothetical protein